MKNETVAPTKKQLELTLPTPTCPATGFRRPRRYSRARWWFEQMHRVVDEAASWPTSTPDRTGETGLTLSGVNLQTPRR